MCHAAAAAWRPAEQALFTKPRLAAGVAQRRDTASPLVAILSEAAAAELQRNHGLRQPSRAACKDMPQTCVFSHAMLRGNAP